ncbi:unnamed protein product [Darwinula stevensoni]|uniref:Carbohydrate sulfotransferase n=1 Tax=Darwinula stevensoni TaxID=69355 RepID=A0A7R8XGE3_9CRUS|nr:unnamed protein product [Darwinula stevensoni]CAG0889644.1 unnamed protein product [Darwinula stevensoni]
MNCLGNHHSDLGLNWDLHQDETQKDRHSRLQNECQKRGWRPKPRNCNPSNLATDLLGHQDLLHHLLVDDKNSLLYCYVPKVASTNWKRIFMILQGKSSDNNPLHIQASTSHESTILPRLSSFPLREAAHRLQSYFKFVFVRHPIHRLISAFRNKFQLHRYNSTYFLDRYGKKIIASCRNRDSNANQSLENGSSRNYSITFEEFVCFITDAKSSKERKFNEHWQPIYELCSPCFIHYDFIGKYETLTIDAQKVLDLVKVKHLKFPDLRSRSSTAQEIVENFMGSLSEESRQNLFQLYNDDFELFDYDL